ncbi:MAG: hypothetical protein R2939_09490 [Kofleriaceae bacterium]
MTNRTRLASLVAVTLTSLSTTALADDDLFGDGTASAEVSATTSYEAPAADAPAAEAMAADGEAMWGLGTTWPTGGDGAYLNLLKRLSGENWLHLGASFRIDKIGDGADTIIGLGVRGGYRMYRLQHGRVRPFIEPYAGLDIGSLDAAGDTISMTLGGAFGIDFTVLPQFTLGLGVGLGASFTDGFDALHVGTYTTSINATFWWGE